MTSVADMGRNAAFSSLMLVRLDGLCMLRRFFQPETRHESASSVGNLTAEVRTPIEKHDDHVGRRLLSAQAKFTPMRRTGEEIGSGLLEGTVSDELIPLQGDQGALHGSIRMAMDERLRETVIGRDLSASGTEIPVAQLGLSTVCGDSRPVKRIAA